MRSTVTASGARLDLDPREFGFLSLALGHLLHGAPMADHDFRNILGVDRETAEALLNQLDAAEAEADAKARGDHWHPPRG